MLELFRNLLKEEWRIHSSLFGGFMFALFPALLLAISLTGSFFLPLLEKIIPISDMILIVQVAFLMFGLSIGSFGLLGKEVMNRRFGQASLLAYSSRSLPISEKEIFLNFFVKDIVYYFFLWIIPFFCGFALYSILASISLTYSLSLLLILTLSFFMGLSIAFFLSTVYAHSGKLLLAVAAISALFGAIISNILPSAVSSIIIFSEIPSFDQILFYLNTSIVFSAISLYFIKVDYPQKKRLFKNSFNKLSGIFSFTIFSIFISKDYLDFKRSEGGIGKLLFSFLFPLALIFWLINSVLANYIPFSNTLVVFSIFLGIMSSSFYNWLTEYDSFSSYSFLPVKVSTLIKSKVLSYLLINLVSVAILIAAAAYTNSLNYLMPALASFLGISAYALSAIVYLGGLNPNIMLYNAKILLQYLLLLSPVLLALIVLSIINPFYLMAGLFLIPVSIQMIRESCAKWDRWESDVI